MKELIIYEKYLYSILSAVQKPMVLLPAVGLSLTLSSYHWMIFLLLGLFAVDYGTGVYASWIEWKKINTTEKFRTKGFTSEKSRLSLVKIVTYFLFILLSWCIEQAFKIKPFEFGYTEHKVTITLVSMAISCAIEFYSIFFENLPRAGFSISDNLKKVLVLIKSAKKEVKELTNDNNSTE